MSTHVNAGITSKKELATRLMAGEEFTLNKALVKYTPCRTGNPFRHDDDGLEGAWDHFKCMVIENQWHTDIGKPVLCWVSNLSSTDRKRACCIHKYVPGTSYPFEDGDASWVYATPVTVDDLFEGDL